MAPRNNPEAIVVVLDISASSSQLDADGVSYLNKAKDCLSWILKRKILSSSKDEIGIILLGSEETNNALANDDFSDRYDNINVMSNHLSMVTWDMLRQVNMINGTIIEHVDWLDAIVVAMDFLKHSMEGKMFSESKIVVLSTFKSDVKSHDQVKLIVNTINNMNTNLVVIGPDVSSEDSESQNEDLIAQMVSDTKGMICSYDDALTQLRFYNKEAKKPTAWNAILTIGPDIKIPVAGYKKIDDTLDLGWKKISEDGNTVSTDQAYFKQDEVIEQQDIIAGYTFASTIVPFSAVEKQTMSYVSGEKCLTALGFTSLSNVPKHLFVGDTVLYFVPRKNDTHAAVAFTALVKALVESESAIIVRKVYVAGFAPMIGAMIPKIEDEYCMLLFLELPYAEDSKELELPLLCNVKPSQEQLQCIDKLINAMDLTDPEIFEDDEEPYIPEKLINPFKQHVDHCIVLKALDKNQILPREPEKIILDLLKPLPLITERSKDILQEIENVFPLEVQNLDRKKKEGAAVFDPDREVANQPVTDSKTEIDKDASMADLMKTTVFQVSTINPVSDFEAVLKKGLTFTKACEQMQSVITKLFIIRADDEGKKPFSALAFLRKKCIEEEKPELYNTWLGSLKDIILERKDYENWDSIVEENLGLITKLESEKSTIGIEEAKIFNEIKEQNPENSGFEEDMDAEDLLDMM